MSGPSKLDIPKMLEALGIEATQKGKEWVAHCPNSKAHERGDKHPSWRMRDAPLSSKHGSHKCWPCGFGGGPAELVMLVRGFTSLAVAFEWISQFKSGGADEVASITWETSVETRKRDFVLPSEVEFLPLPKWLSLARNYVLKDRGITPAQIERFGIGYATEGRLEGRIVLVARDVHGRPRNYTARSFVDHKKRYLAADARERPDLGAMFGEQFWPAYDQRDAVVVVEGAINGLTVDRAVRIPFATISGSSPHPAHVAKLSTFPLVLLLTDPDKAGSKLAMDLEEGLGRHVQVARALLPKGKDAQDAGEPVVRDALWHAVRRVRSTSPNSTSKVERLFAST